MAAVGAIGGGSRGPDELQEKIENGKFLCEVQWFRIRCELQRDQTDREGEGRSQRLDRQLPPIHMPEVIVYKLHHSDTP